MDTDLEAAYRAALRDYDYPLVAELEPDLDAIDAERETRLTAPGALLAAALWYVGQGIAVFPLTAGGKVPLPGSRGFLDATTDPTQVAAWWSWRPDANIGLPTGHQFDVIDIDGPAGVKSWANMKPVKEPYLIGDVAVIGHVTTPRPGGNHLYVPAVAGRGNKAGIFPGVDYRGRGGFVVAPPSRTDQGTYRWVRPLVIG